VVTVRRWRAEVACGLISNTGLVDHLAVYVIDDETAECRCIAAIFAGPDCGSGFSAAPRKNRTPLTLDRVLPPAR
jgi:hypothetical protein